MRFKLPATFLLRSWPFVEKKCDCLNLGDRAKGQICGKACLVHVEGDFVFRSKNCVVLQLSKLLQSPRLGIVKVKRVLLLFTMTLHLQFSVADSSQLTVLGSGPDQTSVSWKWV